MWELIRGLKPGKEKLLKDRKNRLLLRLWVTILALAILSIGLFLFSCTFKQNLPGLEEKVRLTIMHTSDIHSRIFPFNLEPTRTDQELGLDPEKKPFGGAARLATILKREMKKSDRVVYLDSGDIFQGAPIFNLGLGELEIKVMNELGVDAMVIGNHEFDAGARNLAEKLSGFCAFPTLAANYIFDDPNDFTKTNLAHLVKPYAIITAKGLKLGIIGMGDMGSLSAIGEGGNSYQITPLDQNFIIQKYVNFLKPQVDLVVVLSHLGLSDDVDIITGYTKFMLKKDLEKLKKDDPHIFDGWTEVKKNEDIPDELKGEKEMDDGYDEDVAVNDPLPHDLPEDLSKYVRVWVPGVRGVDLILGGHLHVVLNPPKVLKDLDKREVLIVHSGAFAKFVGRLDLVVERDKGEIVSHKYKVFPVDSTVPEDADMNDLLIPYALQLNQMMRLTEMVAYAPAILPRRPELPNNGSSILGSLVADSIRIRRRVEAQFSVTNTLGIRDNIYPGPIFLEDMFNVVPFENNVTVMYLSGREVQTLLNYATERSAGRGCQSQIQVSGIEFVMHCGQTRLNQEMLEQNQARKPLTVTCSDGSKETNTNPAKCVRINGQTVDSHSTYKMATNDYIANGGSGFKILKRNTTKIYTGLSMRDVVMEYMQKNFKSCQEYLEQNPTYCQLQGGVKDLPQLCQDTGQDNSGSSGTAKGQDAQPVDPVKKLKILNSPCLFAIEERRMKTLVTKE